MDDEATIADFAGANCEGFGGGALSIDAYAWSHSTPADSMLRVGVDGDDAERGARETYASVLIVNDADREVNLNGVTVQFEFSKLIRLDDAASEFTTLGEFEFTCWGSQIVSPSGARRIVDCGDLSVQMNDIGPRVDFGAIALNAGEFLAGGYSNFLFSFRDRESRVLDAESVRALDPTCDPSAFTTTSSVMSTAPTSTFGWNPNAQIMLSACPSLLDVVFSTLESQIEDGVARIRGIVGHRSCSTLDASKVTFAIDLGGDYEQSQLQVACEGLQIVYPISSVPMSDVAATCEAVVTERGVELSFGDDLVLCPGCFIVGGPNNVVLDLSYADGRGFSSTEISPNGLREPICAGFPRGDGPTDAELVRPCDEEANAEYEGSTLTTGLFLVPSPEACCLACRENPNCNVWTFCTANDGCGRSEFAYSYSSCELKYAAPEIISQDTIPGKRGPNVTYISGALRDKEVEPVPFDTSNERKECRAETNANYDGIQISIVNAVSWSACCDACLADPACAVWNFCDDVNGCDGEFAYQTCVLKLFLVGGNPQKPPAIARGDGVPWVSGSLIDRIPEPAPSIEGCRVEQNANYKGHPLNSGSDLVVDSETECCAECKRMKKCNAWVFCASIDGCGNEYYDYKFGECWLKKLSKEDVETIPVPAWERGDKRDMDKRRGRR